MTMPPIPPEQGNPGDVAARHARIRRNVERLVAGRASDDEIDLYLRSEGAAPRATEPEPDKGRARVVRPSRAIGTTGVTHPTAPPYEPGPDVYVHEPVVVSSRPSLPRRVGQALKDVGGAIREDPLGTLGGMAADIVRAPIESAQLATAPNPEDYDPSKDPARKGLRRPLSDLITGEDNAYTYDRFGERRVVPPARTATPEQRRAAQIQTLMNLATLAFGAGGGVPRAIALASGTGAAYDPEDPARGAVLGAGFVAAPHAAAAPARRFSKYFRRGTTPATPPVDSRALEALARMQFADELERGAVEAGTAQPRGATMPRDPLDPEAQALSDFAASLEQPIDPKTERAIRKAPGLDVDRPADVVQRQAETAARGIRRRPKAETTPAAPAAVLSEDAIAASPALSDLKRLLDEERAPGPGGSAAATASETPSPPAAEQRPPSTSKAPAVASGLPPELDGDAYLEKLKSRNDISDFEKEMLRNEYVRRHEQLKQLREDAAPASPTEPLPSYPEGFSMGDPESRIPSAPPRATGTDAPSTYGGKSFRSARGIRNDQGELRRDLADIPSDEIADEVVALGNAIGEDANVGHFKSDDSNHWSTNPNAGKLFGNEGSMKAAGRNKSRREAMERLTAELKRRGVDAEAEIEAAVERGAIVAEGRAAGSDFLDYAFGRREDAPTTIDELFAHVDEAATEPKPRTPEAGAMEIPTPGTTKGPPATKPREYINWRTWGERPEIMARIQQRADELRAAGQLEKGRVSFDEQRRQSEAFAKELVADPLQLDPTKLKQLEGHQIVALKEVVQEHAAIMESAARALNSGELSPDEIARATLAMDGAREATDKALSIIVRESARAGRTLGGLRQMARQTLDPDVWTVQAKRLLGDKPLPDQVMLEIRKLARDAQMACGGPS